MISTANGNISITVGMSAFKIEQHYWKLWADFDGFYTRNRKWYKELLIRLGIGENDMLW